MSRSEELLVFVGGGRPRRAWLRWAQTKGMCWTLSRVEGRYVLVKTGCEELAVGVGGEFEEFCLWRSTQQVDRRDLLLQSS